MERVLKITGTIAITVIVLAFIAMGIMAILTKNTDLVGIDFENVEDGSYTASHQIGIVSVQVQTEVEDEQAIEINIIDHFYVRGEDGEKVVYRVLEKQSTDVDTVSGATTSSVCILKAIENSILE